jgi:hypothetical protein
MWGRVYPVTSVFAKTMAAQVSGHKEHPASKLPHYWIIAGIAKLGDADRLDAIV